MTWDRKNINQRIYILLIIGTILFSGIVGQLVRWQLVQASDLRDRAIRQRSIDAPLNPSRGDFYDRNNVNLTNKTQQLSLVVYPKLLQQPETSFTAIQSVLGDNLPYTDYYEFIKLNHYVTEIQVEQMNRLESINDDGITIISHPRRYSGEGFASHLLGYINAADNQGEAGVELMFNSIVKSIQPRYRLVAMVDGKGRLIPGAYYRMLEAEEKQGKVYLHIDEKVQTIVETIANQYIKKGAIMVSDPNTGALLAMVSRPMFVADRLKDYLHKPESPFTNRSISPFPPGSIFKILVAVAALEEGLVEPSELFFCPGYYDLGHQKVRCHTHDDGGHGEITFFDGMVKSCNTTFIQVGQRVGMAKLREYSERLGLGTTTELNFPGERAGSIPNNKYYSPGDVANISIGQGELLVTPAQMLVLINTIANNGKYNPLTVVSAIQQPEDEVREKVVPIPGRQLISQSTAHIIKDMLEGVTVYGTGKQANLPYLRAAGKTGTAQTGNVDAEDNSVNHAWFVGYFPVDNPKYSVVIFIEEGMSGGSVASPVFRRIMEEITMQINPNSH